MDVFADAQPGAQAQQHRDPADGRWYSPNRDFAYVGPALIKQALLGFNLPVDPESPYYELLHQLPQEQHEQELKDFAKTIATLIMRSAKESRTLVDIANELTAADDPGMKASWQVKTAILARMGEIATGCIFAAIQDITPEGGEPPHQRSIDSLVRVASELGRVIGK